MSNSPLLALYLAASKRAAPLANRLLAKRSTQGKELVERLDERRGISAHPRPKGSLVWMHAASVGEAVSLIELINALLNDDPDLWILITTGTVSSAGVLEKRMPEQCIHQFVPMDVTSWVSRFLDHWKPDVAVWCESEFWPNLIVETHKRDIAMISLNSRMSETSFKRWKLVLWTAQAILRKFDQFLAQDNDSAQRLAELGVDPKLVQVTGSLKASGGALPYDEDERDRIALALEARPVWLAASTHANEEILAAKAHRLAQRSSPRLLLIIAPRHPERGPDIAKSLRDADWRVGVRSEGDQPDTSQDIYLADTLNEMGLWFRLAPVTFLGGSLVDVGGHNPYEPAALGSAILHGPYVQNARDTYRSFYEAGASRQVIDVKSLAEAVSTLLEPHKAADLAHRAWELSSQGAEALERATVAIQDALDAPRGS